VVAWSDVADVYLLNSCTVTAKADQECRRLARQVKRRHPEARVVVAGCYAQTQPQDLAGVPEIDLVLGNTTKEQVERWLPRVLPGDGPRPDATTVLVEEFARRPALESPLIDEFDGRSRAFVKVQDGCDLRCSYCLIWRARGPARSRPLDLVVEQIARLHERSGYRELVLTGVHLGAWGRDLPGRPPLVSLVEAVADRFPRLRLRLSSIHPDELDDDLVGLLRGRPQLRPHLHVSLQSGSDAVLRRMRRPYRAEHARAAVAAATTIDPHCGLGADVIVGFPGETDADFAATVDLIETLPFTYLHVFRYSPRPGTPAAELPPVHPETVSSRSAVLRDLGRRKRREFLAALVGSVREAVVEDADPERPGLRRATTDNYAPVDLTGDLPAGSLVTVRCDRLADDRLAGTVLEVLQEASP
jgi:threonylcarbamoyladenosine tRNA methylthiotransferase MtaB